MEHIKLSLKNELVQAIHKNPIIGNYYLKPHFNTKYKLDHIIDEILFVLKTGVAWRDLRSTINWSTVYWHHQRFVKNNIYKSTYANILDFYFTQIKSVNGIIVDSSFFQNKFGKNKIARNKFFKNKNCCKLSILNDLNGIPFSVITKEGNFHDITIFEEHKSDIDKFAPLTPNNNSIYFMADKAYHSKAVYKYFNDKHINVLIPAKKIKNKPLIKFNKKHKQLYAKRLTVEHLFKDIKRFKRLNMIFDSNHDTFIEFIYLAIASICVHKINVLCID